MCVCSIRLQSAVVEFFWGALGAPLKFSTISNIVIKRCCVSKGAASRHEQGFFLFCLLSTRTNNWTKFLHLPWMCVTGHHLNRNFQSWPGQHSARIDSKKLHLGKLQKDFQCKCIPICTRGSKTLCFPQLFRFQPAAVDPIIPRWKSVDCVGCLQVRDCVHSLRC